MKKTAKLVLMSVLTIALCVSLIAGATFALFTDDDSVNITVSSGKVDVSAKIRDFKAYSYDANTDEVLEGFWGGEAICDETTGNIKLTDMVPYDGVEFYIDITNDSTVAIKWQLEIACDGDILDSLDFKVEGWDGLKDMIDVGSAQLSTWQEGFEDTITLHVTMEMPKDVEDQDQEGNISITVYAVQGNAKTTDPEAPVDGTYYIYSASDLEALATSVNNGTFTDTTVKLMKDIDLTNVAHTPIGTSAQPFKATFDGNGQKISNMTIDLPDTDNVGLFGDINGATIKNVVISNANVTGNKYVGVALGNAYTSGNINNVTVLDSEVYGLKDIGGIAGHGYVHVTNCTVDGLTAVATPVDGDDGDKVGGIIGFSADSGPYNLSGNTVKNANLTAYRDLGAITGAYYGVDVVSLINGITVDNVTLTLDRTSYYVADKPFNVRNIIGMYNGGGDMDVANDLIMADERNTIGNIVIDIIGVDSTVDAQGVWTVYTAQGLEDVREYFNQVASNPSLKGMSKNTIKLAKDIDLAGTTWTPIGLDATDPVFRGVFDGQGHKIMNMTINESRNYVGFFANVNYATAEIKNVTFENATVNGGSYTGVVAGRFGAGANPKMTNVTLTGKIQVTGAQYVGAVVGHLGGILEDITVDADSGSLVKGEQVGGLAGATKAGDGSYTNISINIDLEGILVNETHIEGIDVGGIVGWEQGNNVYTNCSYTGTLTSAIDDARVNECFGGVAYAGTTVDGFTFIGKIVGGTHSGLCAKGCYEEDADATFTNYSVTYID